MTMLPRIVKFSQSLSRLCEKRHKAARSNLAPFLSFPEPAYLDAASDRRIAIVVGNGPSLRNQCPEDFPAGTIFVCNYAHKLPNGWHRASQHLVVGDPDPYWLPEVVDAGAAMRSGSTIYVSAKAPAKKPPSWDSVRVVRTHAKHRLLDHYGYPKSALDLAIPHDESGLYRYRHTPMLAIQIALIQGFKRIILAGLDHNHVIRQLIDDVPRVDHAYVESVAQQEVMPKQTYLALAEEIRATWGMYAALGTLAHLMGAEIIDATIAGQLDVFPKFQQL